MIAEVTFGVIDSKPDARIFLIRRIEYNGVGNMADERLKEQTVNISKDTVIYDQGEAIHSICIVAKGRVLVQNERIRSVVTAGSVLGALDLYRGESYTATYTATEDTVLLNIPAETSDDVKTYFESNINYGGLLATFYSRRVRQVYSIYQIIKTEAVAIKKLANEVFDAYISSCNENFIKPKATHIDKIFSRETNLELEYMPEVQYYIAVTALDAEVQKRYFSSNKAIYMHHVNEQYMLLDSLYHDVGRIIDEYNNRVKAFITDRNSIYAMIAEFCGELAGLERDNREWIERLAKINKEVNNIEDIYKNYIIDKVYIDRERLERLQLSATNPGEEEQGGVDIKELNNAFDKLMEYGKVDSAEANEFWNYLESYDRIEDKMAVDKNLAAVREGINKHYYKIYGTIFRKAVREKEIPIYARLFLEYGFVSERFLTEAQLNDIIRLQGKKDSGDLCKVYTLFEWLKLIYSGKKEPSKNEFDLDYSEFLRDQMKNKVITEKDAELLKKDKEKKLQYELDNVFKSVNRLLVTKATAFVPILHKDNCVQALYQSRLTAYRINTSVRKILDIDFSLFSREVMYTNPGVGITKDFIVKEAYPDVILFPCYGNRGVMWQDISGKKRDTEGRIIYPILFEGEEYPNLVAVMGRFRWELCKTIQGIKWNDIRIKSLTSEYQDYVQFFRKNSNLSDEWKDKINRQIKNARSNTREVFVGDYTEWILRESTGGMRISKSSREILATYCPFSKAIRDNLERMPIYSNAMKRFNIENKKKIKEYEGKCSHIKQRGFSVPEEIEKTKDYYYK